MVMLFWIYFQLEYMNTSSIVYTKRALYTWYIVAAKKLFLLLPQKSFRFTSDCELPHKMESRIAP